MYNKLKDENVIIELENLIKNCDDNDDITTSYVLFMKERIMAVSGIN